MDDHTHQHHTEGMIYQMDIDHASPVQIDNTRLLRRAAAAAALHDRASTLTLTAQCKLAGLALPFDVGLLFSNLNVYHDHYRIGHLVTIFPEVDILKSNNGNFSLLASLNIDNTTAFHNFASHLLQDDTVAWRLSDDQSGVTVHVRVPFFGTFMNMYVPYVHMNKTVVMKGCGAFENTSLEVFYLDDLPTNATGGDVAGLNVHMTAKVFNPSLANVTDMGRIHFDMSYSSSTINDNSKGDAGEQQQLTLGYLETDESLSVVPGWNVLRGTGRFNAQGSLADDLIHNFMMGLPTRLRASAPLVNASSDPLFSQFVGGLSLETTLTGSPRGLIEMGQWLLTEELIIQWLNPNRKKPLAVPFVSQLKNPFGAVIHVHSSFFDIIYKNVTVGVIKHQNMTTIKPRNGTSWTNVIPIDVNLKIPGMTKLTNEIVVKMLEDGYVMLSLRGNFSFTSGGLHFAPKNYAQLDNVPCCIGWPLNHSSQNRTCRPRKNRTHMYIQD